MIHVEHLSFTYAGGSHPAVRDISFDIAPGEVFGFLGPSGADKSTTQKVLIGLLGGYHPLNPCPESVDSPARRVRRRLRGIPVGSSGPDSATPH